MSDLQLRVCALYPGVMNIYADRGNLAVLRKRCEWRGISVEIAGSEVGDTIDPQAHDFYYIGGGQDRDQLAVASDMQRTKRAGLTAAAASGAVVLAVCGGYQLLGRFYRLGGRDLPGLDLVDIETVRESGPRLIGNVVIEADLGDGPRHVTGFENHGGRTYLGDGAVPLGRVLAGFGNNGRDRGEGVRRDNVIGTYLHGPLLPKNPWLADRLIELALERRMGVRPSLTPLDDTIEHAAGRRALERAMTERGTTRRRRTLRAGLGRLGRRL